MKSIISFEKPFFKIKVYGFWNVLFVYAVRAISTNLYFLLFGIISLPIIVFLAIWGFIKTMCLEISNYLREVYITTKHGDWKWDNFIWGKYYKYLEIKANKYFEERKDNENIQ